MNFDVDFVPVQALQSLNMLSLFLGKKHVWISVCSSLLGMLLLSCTMIFVLWRRKAAKRKCK